MGKVKRVLSGVVRASLTGMLILGGMVAAIATFVAIPYLASQVLNAPDWVVFIIVFVELSLVLGLMTHEGDLY